MESRDFNMISAFFVGEFSAQTSDSTLLIITFVTW